MEQTIVFFLWLSAMLLLEWWGSPKGWGGMDRPAVTQPQADMSGQARWHFVLPGTPLSLPGLHHWACWVSLVFYLPWPCSAAWDSIGCSSLSISLGHTLQFMEAFKQKGPFDKGRCCGNDKCQRQATHLRGGNFSCTVSCLRFSLRLRKYHNRREVSTEIGGNEPMRGWALPHPQLQMDRLPKKSQGFLWQN